MYDMCNLNLPAVKAAVAIVANTDTAALVFSGTSFSFVLTSAVNAALSKAVAAMNASVFPVIPKATVAEPPEAKGVISS